MGIDKIKSVHTNSANLRDVGLVMFSLGGLKYLIGVAGERREKRATVCSMDVHEGVASAIVIGSAVVVICRSCHTFESSFTGGC